MPATAQSFKSTAMLQVSGPACERDKEVLNPAALAFVAALAERFAPRVAELLATRETRQARFDGGELPDFRADTRHIRESAWQVAAIPADLLDRRVEITGPVDRKMVINALNSGARVFMADFEDSLAPTWRNVVDGQANLKDAVAGTIDFQAADGRRYTLNPKHAVLVVRPRGWHLTEKHARLEGRAIPAALLDFGLYLFHNAKALQQQGTGPYYYLPKLEAYEEAQLWEDVISFSEDSLGLERGTVKVTALIETLPAAFEMDEILYALREHIVGLNCGRWDYIFSFIKKFQRRREFVLPERGQITMSVPFLRAYSLRLIQTCHRRGAFAMGGMAAQIPIKNDTAANEAALAKVRADKEREAGDGHDGTWVAHPGLIPVAMEIFDRHLTGPNQLHRLREDVKISAADLLAVPKGDITATGFRNNIDVTLQYLAAWLAGNGCVPIYNLMEDAATAEISRTQLWQWLHQPDIYLASGEIVDRRLFDEILADQHQRLLAASGPQQKPFVERAAQILNQLVNAERLQPFLTSIAYGDLE